MSRQLKDVTLEAYLANALAPDVRAQVEQTVASSPEDAARVEALRAETQAFLFKHPPAAFAARLQAKQGVPWFRRLWLIVPALAASAAAFLVLFASPPPAPEVITKGAVAVTVHRQTAKGSEVLEASAIVHAGDALRFAVTTPSAGYVWVLLRAGPKDLPLLPENATSPVQVEGGQTLLDGAVTLDGESTFEIFVVAWSPTPFTLDDVASPRVTRVERRFEKR
ncbi:MAG: hypothetical protein JNG84_12445 [Archangium sp.]|nr:hypothetical protein [Archangium sp.]